jgi:hypothetical protein
MPDAPVPPLVVYPELWRQSREQHPHDWQWPDQLRALCRLARDYRRTHPRVVNALPDGERLFLQSLAQIDTEQFVAMLRSDFAHEQNPMLRIDPSDRYVEQPVATTMNGHKVFDA